MIENKRYNSIFFQYSKVKYFKWKKKKKIWLGWGKENLIPFTINGSEMSCLQPTKKSNITRESNKLIPQNPLFPSFHFYNIKRAFKKK